MAYRAYYFLKSNNKSPLEEYLQSINSLREIAGIQILVEKLLVMSGRLPIPYAKHIEGKIWELRTRLGNRVFYFIHTGNEIILLDGHTKKRDRIEPRALRRVRQMYREYIETGNRKPY